VSAYDDEFDSGPGEEDAALDRAWTALETGDAKRALAELATIDPDWPERWLAEALARVEVGEAHAARALLARAKEIDDIENHPDYLWAKAQLHLAEWHIEDARATLERLIEIERSASALERLSLCAELEGDFDRADRWIAEAAELDPAHPAPTRLDEPAFEQVIATAIDTLPAEIRRALERSEVTVEAVPQSWMIDLSEPFDTPPDMLGLFVGASDLERGEADSGELPPRIFLFQRNLERAARDRQDLLEQIRVTLFHEIGHMLGFDEDGVAELGLE
jgi:predicted Zn-dependent protease with MMP-like domain